MLTHLSLFSGIGGNDLAAEWAGFKTIAMCEINPFCQKVLKKHWPEVPIIEDIHDVKGKNIISPITVITGGFPCQPVSSAGLR
jgi:DNA (cytosine-5)-methyltransferase 1